MKNQTIFQVDPIALRQKLRKLGIGPGIPLSPTFAEDAVRDCLNLHAGQAEIVAEDTEIHGSVSLEFPSRTMAPGPGTLVLEPSELAYCLHNWAALWSVPE